MNLYMATITLILVMDPLGNIPCFMSILGKYTARMQRWIILRETFIALIILLLFLFGGQHIMAGLHITTSALSIAGGIILFLIALRMIFPAPKDSEEEQTEPFIVPLAVPMIAGPSALALVMLMVADEPQKMLSWLAAIIIATVVFLVVMLAAPFLNRFLGSRGLTAVERLMGMVLTTVAVQMFLTGIEYFLKKP